MDSTAWVFIVDDDSRLRSALVRLLRTAGLRAIAFSSAAEFLKYQRPQAPSCLILDVQMPGLNGMELQSSLQDHPATPPIVFITGHGDIPMGVQAMKSGAVDFLTKPFDGQKLLNAVRQAIAQDARDWESRSLDAVLRQRAASLSPREREVLAHVVSGRLNKQIARRLGVTEKTVKVHRGQVMRKMQARSLAELVRMADKLGIHAPAEEGRRAGVVCT